MKKILLLSGYDASSHKYWRNTIVESLPEYEWIQLSLPDRYFSWRMRSNSLSFAQKIAQLPDSDFELLIVTSMVDLSALRGFVPSLVGVPTIMYFHENQFVYPISKEQPNILNNQLTSIYSAICADNLVFNSQYNLETFLAGAQNLVKKMPDGIEHSWIKKLAEKSGVLAVPISVKVSHRNEHLTPEIPTILWNHRWEYDKQPEVFFKAMEKLISRNIKFKIKVLGQSFRQSPSCFEEAEENLSPYIANWGYLSRAEYLNALETSTIVVSAAIHEFQGLSMMEAIASGCTPVAPARLVYPEYIPSELLYEPATEIESESANLAGLLAHLIDRKNYPQVSVNKYSSEVLIPQYKSLIENML